MICTEKFPNSARATDSSNGKQVHATERIARAILILLFGSVVSGVDVYMIFEEKWQI